MTGRIRMIATDIDGTILGPSRGISERTLLVLRECIDRGIPVVLVTGRRLRSALGVARGIHPEVLVVASDGAVSVKPATGEVIYARGMPVDYVLAQVRIIEEAGLPVFVHRLNLDGPEVYYRMGTRERRKAREYVSFLGADAQVLKRPSSLDSNAMKLYTLGPYDLLESIMARLEPPVSATVTRDPLHDTSWLQIIRRDTDKGVGLRIVADRLGVDPSEVAAFGDNYNDLPMFDAAGFAVAVEDGVAEARDRADHITGACECDGVAAFLEATVLRC